MVCVVCHEFGEPGSWICDLAARSPVRVDDCDGIGAVTGLKSDDDVLLVCGVDVCCVELYRRVFLRDVCGDECGGVCVLPAVGLSDAGLGVGCVLWKVVSALRVLKKDDVRFAI